jgi:hypothetical protein
MINYTRTAQGTFMGYEDIFTGSWQCNLQESRLSRVPRCRIQRITVSGDAIDVQEDIENHDGTTTQVRVEAKFDGMDYPVIGSILADSMAYTRYGNVISGTAKKSGAVSLQETVQADGSRMVTNLAIFAAGKQVASGVAVFDKIEPLMLDAGI